MKSHADFAGLNLSATNRRAAWLAQPFTAAACSTILTDFHARIWQDAAA